jgi:hypothetical protein
MSVADPRTLALNEGVLLEQTADDGRIVLWLRGAAEGDFQLWERVGSVARGEITTAAGICSVEATSVAARQRVRGVFGKLASRFRDGSKDQSLSLPGGESVKVAGKRRADFVLAWAAEGAPPIDETRILARWPECRGFRALGANLVLVSGVEPKETRSKGQPASTSGTPREQAEAWLATTRATGDRRGELAALIDLGIFLQQDGDAGRALLILEEALELSRKTGDRQRDADLLQHLARAALETGQVQRSLELFEQAWSTARAASDPFAEKLILQDLGDGFSRVNHDRALGYLEQALALARKLGDRKHEADLLWKVGIQHAELGRRDRAIAAAEAAVDLMVTQRRPDALAYGEHLERYRAAGLEAGGDVMLGMLGGSFDASVSTVHAGANAAPVGKGPGILQMAVTAAKSMAKFAKGGFETVPTEVYRARTKVCSTCEHHTGLRCRVCGCFTGAKAHLPHEDCPLGKWPIV